MSGKTIGRPKLKDPINRQITVRLKSETMERLDKYCAKKQITKGEAVRRGVEQLLDKEKMVLLYS